MTKEKFSFKKFFSKKKNAEQHEKKTPQQPVKENATTTNTNNGITEEYPINSEKEQSKEHEERKANKKNKEKPAKTVTITKTSFTLNPVLPKDKTSFDDFTKNLIIYVKKTSANSVFSNNQLFNSESDSSENFFNLGKNYAVQEPSSCNLFYSAPISAPTPSKKLISNSTSVHSLSTIPKTTLNAHSKNASYSHSTQKDKSMPTNTHKKSYNKSKEYYFEEPITSEVMNLPVNQLNNKYNNSILKSASTMGESSEDSEF